MSIPRAYLTAVPFVLGVLVLTFLIGGCGGGMAGSGAALSSRTDGQIAIPSQVAAVLDVAQHDAGRTVSTPAILVSPGKGFTVPVAISDGTGVAGAMLRLGFDPGSICGVGVEPGDWASPTAQVAATAGRVEGSSAIAIASVTAATSGPGTLATFRLAARPGAAAQNTTLRLSGVLVDARGNTIGHIGAPPPSSVRPASTGGLIGDLLGTGHPEVGSAIKILRVVVSLDPPPAAGDLPQWDANKSNAVDVGDAIRILRCVVALDAWPIGTCGPTYAPYLTWGSTGSADGQFMNPHGIAVEAGGTVYVSDPGTVRIQKFTSTGGFLTKWGSVGTGDGQFGMNMNVAVDAARNAVYSVDLHRRVVQKFTTDGAFVLKWGSQGTDEGQFEEPGGIAVDTAANVVYVTDAQNSNIQKFGPDGTFVARWGVAGTGDGQFKRPQAVAVGSAGTVFVADTDNNRIQVLTREGEFVRKWGGPGIGDGQFGFPQGIATDASDTVFVADTLNNRVQIFTAEGVFLTKFGSAGQAAGQFGQAGPLGVDGAGNIYVVDILNQRIQKFALAP